VLPVTAQMRAALLSDPTEAAIGAAAHAHGMMTLRGSALAAAHRGETTYEEVLRTTHVDTVDTHLCPSCARALAEDMVCCPFDGTPVGRQRCESCERPLDTDWATCPYCRTPVAGRAPTAPPAAKPERLPRLLVIEDDMVAAHFVVAALTGSAEVTLAATAEEGLARVGVEDFDGVLIDNGLPDMGGVELIRLLRSDPKTLTLPLVLFTASSSPEVERAARRAGADDFLAKPVEPLLLEERVLRLLNAQTRRT
jgi:CheY-like chemotaxis protein